MKTFGGNLTSSVLAMLLIGATFAPASTTTVALQPGPENGKDISLYERTDIEVSASKSLYTINTGPPGPGLDDFSSLAEFDLASMPAGQVASAKLWLFENNVPTFSFQHVSPAFPNTVRVDPAAAAWEQDNVFYSTLPAAVPGYTAELSVDGVNEWFSWDVTQTVTDWLAGELVNNGFLITSALEVRNGSLVVGAAFDASEQPHPPYLEIELMSVQPGDYNGDGIVNAADYDRWKTFFGSGSPEPDGNGDGIVGSADYTVWRNNLRAVATAIASTRSAIAPIPEPRCTALLVAALGLLMVCTWRQRSRLPLVATAALLLLALPAANSSAVTVPFLEDFANDGRNWRQNDSTLDVNYIPTGGVGGEGDGYVSVERIFTANPDFAQTVFRGHDQFDASDDVFVGDWQSAGVSEFSYYIRHNAATDLSFGTRFATSANSPGANAVASLGLIAQPNEWTRISIPIIPGAIVAEGPPSFFDTVFQNLGNVQISARPGNNLNTPIQFDLDRVAIVPEPASAALVAGIAICLLGVIRRRANTKDEKA